MREIKFRGICIEGCKDGEWIYGFLVIGTDKDKPYMIFNGDGDHCEHLVAYEYYEVDYETIGQYTGLKDKKGVEIYEGDMLDIYKGSLLNVFWSDFHCSYYLGTDNCKLDSYDCEKYEIVGNIHEDKHLLEEK